LSLAQGFFLSTPQSDALSPAMLEAIRGLPAAPAKVAGKEPLPSALGTFPPTITVPKGSAPGARPGSMTQPCLIECFSPGTCKLGPRCGFGHPQGAQLELTRRLMAPLMRREP